MNPISPKWTVIIILAIALIGAGLFLLFNLEGEKKADVSPEPIAEKEKNESEHKIIGKSVEGRDIESFTYGNGDTHIVFVGGIHGGYEGNSVLLSYKFIDYLNENPDFIPDRIKVSVIPSANPDGVYEVVGKEGRFDFNDVPEGSKVEGRFNANGVDLNRNFDCKWQPESMWRGQKVSAGTAPFSEPEAQAIRDFVLEDQVDIAVFWHSQSNAVYASECENGVLPETITVMNTYSEASGYPAVESFDYYEITGDAEGWLASIGIPAVSVELKTHETVEWERNLAGIKALFEHYME